MFGYIVNYQEQGQESFPSKNPFLIFLQTFVTWKMTNQEMKRLKQIIVHIRNV